MDQEKVFSEHDTFHHSQMDSTEFDRLVRQAKDSADADSKLSIMQALGKYKKAVFWAMILSTSLVMEGYDLVIVSDDVYGFIENRKACKSLYAD